MNPSENIIELPSDGIITVEWARISLERAALFSTFDLNMNKSRVFFMLKTHLSIQAYEEALKELEYTAPTVEVYLQFLSKAAVLEAIRDKYFIPISLSASELIPDELDEALALCDVALSKFHRITADTLAKALDLLGKTTKKLSNAAISVEANKKAELMKWLKSEHNLSESDVLDAQRLHPEGKSEYLEKSIAAFALLGDWQEFYSIIAKPVHDSGNSKALRFLADINDSSGSIMEFLAAEEAHTKLNALKETFNNVIYPQLSFEASK